MIDLEAVDRDYRTARERFRIDVPERFNLGFDVVDRWAATADKTAILAVSRDGGTATPIAFSALSERTNRFANALAALGVRPGDFACVVIGRVPAWYTVLIGCMKAGVVSMPGTTLLTSKDIAYRIGRSDAALVIVTPDHCDKVDAVRGECPTLKHFIVAGPERPGWLSLDALCEASSPVLRREDAPDLRSTDMMMAYFTSGTTSYPKMVPRDFGYGLAHAATGLFWMDLRRDDLHWTLTDTGWAKAAWGMLFPQMLVGATTVLYDGVGFDADFHLRLIETLGVTTFCAPPTAYRMFAQLDLKQYDLSTVRRSMSAGEPLNPEIIRTWQQNTGTVVADGYGQTETINIVANTPGEEVRFGSMGRPVPGYDIDVVDDAGNRLPDGDVGHIAVRLTDPWPAGLFHGYYTKDGLDTGAFRNGWYYTGDTASRDKDGYLWFVGRADDLIGSAGYRISPFEVESVLIEHPAVAESAVVGKPDATRGEIVKAFIVLARTHQAGDALAAEIQEFCKKTTAPYKYPREIEFVDTLPKTISGKIRRVELRGGAGNRPASNRPASNHSDGEADA